MMKTKKEIAVAIIKDTVADLLYYDRKEDEEMSREDIQRVFDDGLLTIDEAVALFREELINGLDTSE